MMQSPAVSIYGFYGHAGNSYASTSLSEATSFLAEEVKVVNDAARITLDVLAQQLKRGPPDTPFVLSVGSTPTAQAASTGTKTRLGKELCGTLELHAGT
jgi:D-serine ammonia-lyase